MYKANQHVLETTDYPYCADIQQYTKILEIGHGTFGKVFKAKRKDTGELVAVKCLMIQDKNEGIPFIALREIKVLQMLSHKNIVNLIEVCKNKSYEKNNSYFLVFEYCDHELDRLLKNQHFKISLSEKKDIMKQLLNGLYYIHKNNVLHRDIKPANILINNDGIIKIADFGLARTYERNRLFTNEVVTLWYRAPELLFGEREYSYSVDMWSVGCLMAELFTRIPIIKGTNEHNQLSLISYLCGTIDEYVWPDVTKYSLYNKLSLPKNRNRVLKERLNQQVRCESAIDLIDKLLTIDPNERLNTDEALDHDFFYEEPSPKCLTFSNKFESYAIPKSVPIQIPKKCLVNQEYYDRIY